MTTNCGLTGSPYEEQVSVLLCQPLTESLNTCPVTYATHKRNIKSPTVLYLYRSTTRWSPAYVHRARLSPSQTTNLPRFKLSLISKWHIVSFNVRSLGVSHASWASFASLSASQRTVTRLCPHSLAEGNDTHDHWLWKTGYRLRRNRKCCTAPLQNISLTRMTAGWCPHSVTLVAVFKFCNHRRSTFLLS